MKGHLNKLGLKNNMKKAAILVVCIIMMLCCVGCGGNAGTYVLSDGSDDVELILKSDGSFTVKEDGEISDSGTWDESSMTDADGDSYAIEFNGDQLIQYGGYFTNYWNKK